MGGFRVDWNVVTAISTAVVALTSLPAAIREFRKITAEAREQKPSPSKVSDFPVFTPVSRKAWLLFVALAILNFGVLISVAIEEPLTTRNVVLIALNFFATAWSLATPIFITLLRTIAHAQKVHLWLVEFAFKEQFGLIKNYFDLTKTYFDFTKGRFQNQFDFTATMVKCVQDLFKTMLDHKELITHQELVEQIRKQLDEIDRLVTKQKIDHEGTSDSSPTTGGSTSCT
jgi:hypothetical protein